MSELIVAAANQQIHIGERFLSLLQSLHYMNPATLSTYTCMTVMEQIENTVRIQTDGSSPLLRRYLGTKLFVRHLLGLTKLNKRTLTAISSGVYSTTLVSSTFTFLSLFHEKRPPSVRLLHLRLLTITCCLTLQSLGHFYFLLGIWLPPDPKLFTAWTRSAIRFFCPSQTFPNKQI